MTGRKNSIRGVNPRLGSVPPTFWDLKVGHIYCVRSTFSGDEYRIAWFGSPRDPNVIDLGFVVNIEHRVEPLLEIGLYGATGAPKKEWVTFLIGERTLKLCRADERLPWSTYFELVR